MHIPFSDVTLKRHRAWENGAAEVFHQKDCGFITLFTLAAEVRARANIHSLFLPLFLSLHLSLTHTQTHTHTRTYTHCNTTVFGEDQKDGISDTLNWSNFLS